MVSPQGITLIFAAKQWKRIILLITSEFFAEAATVVLV
jgi:hypothetical protein